MLTVMQRLFQTLLFLFFAVISSTIPNTASGAEWIDSDQPKNAQAVTRSYLQGLLNELISLGLVAPDATIETVDWRRFGIVVDVSHLGERQLRKTREFDFDERHFAQQEIADGPFLTCAQGDIDCALVTYLRFASNFQAALQSTPSALCERLASEFYQINTPECSDDGRTSIAVVSAASLKTADQFRLWIGRENAQLPVYHMSVIGSPFLLQQSLNNHLERHDFLVYWTFSQTVEYQINVVPVFSMYDHTADAFDNLRSHDFSYNSEIHFSRITSVGPNELADRVRGVFLWLAQDIAEGNGP